MSECAHEASSRTPPELVAAFRGEGQEANSSIVRLVPDVNGSYQVTHTYVHRSSHPWVTSSTYAGGLSTNSHGVYFVLSNFSGLFLVHTSPQLDHLHAVQLSSVGDVTVTEDRVYLANESLVVYDRDLTLLGSIELPLKDGGKGKMAHDIIVDAGVAYLLDNVVSPLYVLRVNVTDPAAMTVITRDSIWGFGFQLTEHWIDPINGTWTILQERNTLHVWSLDPDGGKTALPLFDHWSEPDSNGTPQSHREGRTIESAVSGPPLWVVSEGAVGSLAVRTEDPKLRFCALSLDDQVSEKRTWHRVAARDDWLVATGLEHLAVLDRSTTPVGLVANQSLGHTIMAIAVAV